jgi:hypothetical protein
MVLGTRSSRVLLSEDAATDPSQQMIGNRICGTIYILGNLLVLGKIDLKHPFTGIVSGPTGSEETYFIRELLKHKPSDVILEEVLWCYVEWQPMYRDIQATFHEGLLAMLPSDGKIRLVIVDDLMREADSRVVDLFTKGSHHRNISVFFITQNLFH